MKVIKRINNNTVLCMDSRGRSVVAFGKGIAFAAPKGEDELPLSAIERTFYNIDEHYLALLDEIKPEVLSIAADVVEAAKPSLPYQLSPNATLALADHIAFALQRQRTGMVVRMPISYDVKQMYPIEHQAGVFALNLISHQLHIELPREEVTGIALCLVNAASGPTGTDAHAPKTVGDDTVIDNIIECVERRYQTKVDRDGFEFARFATHVHYLLDRIHSGAEGLPGESGLYESARSADSEASGCVDEICELLERAFSCTVSDDEKLYLILHVSRVAHRCR